LKQFDQLMVKLKSLDAYHTSTIVFKSDHGEPVNYYDKAPHNQKINGHSLWGYNRYRPTLLIKPAARIQEKMVVQDTQVVTSDLAFTLCVEHKFERCSSFKGINLLGNIPVKYETSDNFYVYLPIDENSSFTIETHKEVEVSRNVSLFDALKRSGDIR
jgi:hypothetical protein